MSGSDGSGYVQAAVDLTKFLVGQTATTNGITIGNQATNTDTAAFHESKTDSVTNTDTSTNTNTKSTTQNSTSPFVIQTLQTLAQQALANSTDPEKTKGILSNFIQSGLDAMKTVFGNTKTAGVYNSTAADVQNGDILSRASADAAQAILSYTTNQQGIAKDAASTLGSLTASSATNTDTNSNTHTSTENSTDQQTTDNAHIGAAVSTNMYTKSQTSTKAGGSLICTYMLQHKLLDRKLWYIVSSHYERLPRPHRMGYLAIAIPLRSYLEWAEGKGFVSAFIIGVFRARTEYICASLGYKYCKKSIRGWLARALVATCVFPPALCYLISSYFPGKDHVHG